jgi:Response regulators consisting of a CheY-like receiver domain and a winged-helix DNA-binding domain
MKVFVIEDNPVYNDYVCNLLKKDSFDTMSAYNLATAKKLLAKSEVDDIVVADLRLPDGESIDCYGGCVPTTNSRCLSL